MRTELMIAVLLVVGLAGCTSEQGPPVMDPWSLVVDRGPCDDQHLGFVVPLERLQAALPEGATARDAQHVLGTPSPTGNGILAVTFVRCSAGLPGGAPREETWVEVYIEPLEAPPEVPARTDASSDFYLFEVTPTTRAWADRWAGVGLAAGRGNTSLVVEEGPPVGSQASLVDAAGVVAETSARFPLEALRSETNHYWHVDGAGLTLVATTRDQHLQRFGTNVACALREGSTAARVAGVTTCAGTATTAVLYPGADLQETLYHWPGRGLPPRADGSP